MIFVWLSTRQRFKIVCRTSWYAGQKEKKFRLISFVFGKFSIFCQNFPFLPCYDSWPKLEFLSKISMCWSTNWQFIEFFDQKFHFLTKISIFGSKNRAWQSISNSRKCVYPIDFRPGVDLTACRFNLCDDSSDLVGENDRFIHWPVGVSTRSMPSFFFENFERINSFRLKWGNVR